MLRFVYCIVISFPFIIYYILKCHYIVKHKENYSEDQRYRVAQRMINIMKRNGRVHTDVYGVENLPEEGGYVMYSNHQGKYDALGIISAHQKPCSFLIDAERSRLPLADEVTALLEGSRLDKTNPREMLRTIMDIVSQVKEGRRFIVFPEGGYDDNRNSLQEFQPGAFRCSIRSKTPIIPVVLRDSYKVFGINSLRKVRTEVHFLKPVYYEEYAKLNSNEVAQLVRDRIQEVLSRDTSDQQPIQA